MAMRSSVPKADFLDSLIFIAIQFADKLMLRNLTNIPSWDKLLINVR